MTAGGGGGKELIRRISRKRREEIAPERRLSAEANALKELLLVTKGHRLVLSYSNIGSELSTREINAILAEEGRLALPKVVGNELLFYRVASLEEELSKGPFGIREPSPTLCRKVEREEITIALVPAIAFDRNNQRIGYGGGYYDRFLATLPEGAIAVGIGFSEQLLDCPIPLGAGDIPLTLVKLFGPLP